jgi:hypothetical protein
MAFVRKPGRGRKKKPLDDDLDMPPSPLDSLEYTGNPEKDSRQEIALSLEALQNKERKKALREHMRLTTDSEYWCALCFETREQKEAFLKAINIYHEGDKYLDGLDMARRLGINLPASSMAYRPTAKENKRLSALVKD